MKSTFFHIGINVTMEQNKEGMAPRLDPTDGSIRFVPLPDHNDPDFRNLTYGDPWGRLGHFDMEDVAWFIESGIVSPTDWGYYLVAYFVVEDVYWKKQGTWNKTIQKVHRERIASNFHESDGDPDYAVILGNLNTSRCLFKNPLRISRKQDPFDEFKTMLGMPLKPATGYWFKKWFEDQATRKMLVRVEAKAGDCKNQVA